MSTDIRTCDVIQLRSQLTLPRTKDTMKGRLLSLSYVIACKIWIAFLLREIGLELLTVACLVTLMFLLPAALHRSLNL
jgi:hypothetical protein